MYRPAAGESGGVRSNTTRSNCAGAACRDVMRGVADHQFDARIVERAAVHLGKCSRVRRTTSRVELRDHDPLDTRMPQQLPRGAAIAAAQHQRRARRRMRERRRMHHALVIDELVAGGRHRAAVEREEPAELRRVPHLDALIRRIDARDEPRVREIRTRRRDSGGTAAERSRMAGSVGSRVDSVEPL